MKLGPISDKWTIIGTAVLMVLALGLLARGLMRNAERAKELGAMTLVGATESQQWRLELLMNSFNWDMEQEAAYVALADSSDDLQLITRWLPVLRSRFAINSIGVADDRGDERVLERADSTWRFISSFHSAHPAWGMARTWPLRTTVTAEPVAYRPRPDPREALWFSQALENRRDVPVWTEATGKNGRLVLHLSQLVRKGSAGVAYKVVHFDIDAAAMLEGMSQWTPLLSTIEFNSEGNSLLPLDTSVVGKVWAQVLGTWRSGSPIAEFHRTEGNEEWFGRIVPMRLNGTTIYTGVMIGSRTIARWNDQGRLALWFVAGLLVLLGILLGMVFLQRRGAAKRERKQERYTSIQARHLAKAIGQREVLDREVHHRVKNNLQVVSSLLNLQAQRLPSPESRGEFMRSKRRIDSMALVHHKLYRQEDLSAVNLHTFMDDLARAVSAMFEPDSRTVSHSVDTAGIRCNADTAIQLGMILCELLANCHQHAFPYATGGHVEITVRSRGDGSFLLAVKDNGRGYDPAGVEPTHLGLDVVAALSEQLDGSVRTVVNEGTLVEVVFKPQHQS